MCPVGRANGNEAGVTARAACELRKAHRDKRADRRNLVEIGDAFGLCVAMVHQPGLSLKRGRGIRIERLMTVKQDLAFQMQELARG